MKTASQSLILLLILPLAIGLIGAAPVPAQEAARLSASAAIELGQVVWRGRPDALETRHGEPIVELAPDGGALLYVQGAPWPRLMVQRLALGATARALGVAAPFGSRTPRFDPEGASVYFTAETSWRPTRPLPPGLEAPDRALVASASLVRLDGSGLQALVPASESRGSTVFIDLHPVGRTALVGFAGALTRNSARAAEYALRLEEVDVGDGRRRELGIEIGSHGLARYSWDGRSIYFEARPAENNRGPGVAEAGPRLFAHDRRTGLNRPLAMSLDRVGRNAADLVVGFAPVEHLGVSAWDGFRRILLSRSIDEPGVALVVPSSLVSDTRGALVPRSFRDPLVLATVGPPDRGELVIARWSSDAYLAARDGLAKETMASLDPGDSRARAARALARLESRVRARADGESRVLLDRLRQTLVSEMPRVTRARALFRAERIHLGNRSEWTLEVVEEAAGRVRIERILPPRNENTPETREALVHDGERVRALGENGGIEVGMVRLVEELSTSSIYRLLLDPAGLTLDDLVFSLPRPVERNSRLRELAFRHCDGFGGLLVVRIGGEGGAAARVVPVEVRTTRLLPTETALRGFAAGELERRLVFDEFKDLGGRVVPTRIEFRGAGDELTLRLEKLVFDESVDDALFERLR